MHAPKILRIRIEKFRRIQEALEVELTTPRGDSVQQAVFAGPNGCGKTSVIEAVLLGLGMGPLIVRDLERSRREEHWRVLVPEGAIIEVDVAIDGANPTTWIRTADKHVHRLPDGTEEPIPPQWLQSLAVEYFSSWRAPELVGPIKPLVGRGGRPIDNETNRLWRLKQRINDERARGGYKGTLPGFGRADAWLNRLNDAWSRFHGDDGTHIDAQIVDPDDEELLADLFVVTDDGRRICSIDQISSGEIELLSFAGWIILNDWKGGLLVIDEPELHLHPQWQATILPALHALAPDVQILVASHADAVWDQTASYARFLLVPDTDPRSRAWREAQPLPCTQEAS
ncbi:AAA family ATPase [Sorangium cellulosum]|uniref:AAA family ATPase n=1 Tax=Sorangium cellulosum TaxID=56 RepID=UPI00031E2BD2|nr:AAA family ATPase [Sorangium cellulosum]